jgi:hypothetical protein
MHDTGRLGRLARAMAAGGSLLIVLAGARDARAADPRDVRVVNGVEEPVPVTGKVKAKLTAERQPFQRDVSITVPAGQLTHATSFTVPAGKRLVLEYASGFVGVSVSELVRVNVDTTVGADRVRHTIAPSVYRREFPPDVQADFMMTFGQPLKVYADPGSTVLVMASRSENGWITPTTFSLALSGYLVDCGPAAGCPIP